MEHFSSYKLEKSRLLEKINVIKGNLTQLQEMDFDCSEAFKKLEETVRSLDNELISIVLVGSFSDGKTSVIAGWLGEQPDSMKIDSDESSDQLEIYKPTNLPEKCEIVDTPGLFGSKEKEITDGSLIKLSDVTKKYIDQANIILYVVDAKNPIKDSHKETVRWIMQDLHKIETTIFVINKMDSVSDITDDDDFRKVAEIKKSTLRDKVKEIANLSEEECRQLKIVCVTSNPNEKGFEFWSKNREIYEARSRINDLESVTNDVLKNTSTTDLIAKTGCDVLERIVRENVEMIENQIKLITNDVVPELEETLRRNEKDYESTKKQILSKQASYIRELRVYEKKLKAGLRATTFESIREFISDEIGISGEEAGFRIQEEISLISQSYFDEATQKVEDLYHSFETQNAKQNEILDAALKKGAAGLSFALKSAGKVPIAQMKGAIVAGRDVLGKVFGASIKFKPWGITKLATGLSKALPLIGAGIDLTMNAVELAKKNAENNKFKQTKQKIEEMITDCFKSVCDNANDTDKYLEMFAPQLKDMEKNLAMQKDVLEKQKLRKEQFLKWKKEAVDVDFITEAK